MELYNALKKVVELQSEDILKDVKLINILSDFKAYDDYPSAKYLLKYMINEGLMANLLFEYQPTKDIELLLKSHINLLSNTYGFKDNLSEFVIRSIAYSLCWTNELPKISENSQEKDNSLNNQQSTTQSLAPDDGKKHISFRQLPLNGTAEQFINNLVSMGYTVKFPYSKEKRVGTVVGSFAGVNNCEILIVGTPLSAIVCRIVIYFPEQQIWFNIKSEYNKWKDKFTAKYGAPQSYEYFTDPYYEGDGYEMTALHSEHCSYSSFFTDKESGGTIVVKMTTYYSVAIIYEDKHNTEIDDIEKNNIENNDI